jgi:hypothetical protein
MLVNTTTQPPGSSGSESTLISLPIGLLSLAREPADFRRWGPVRGAVNRQIRATLVANLCRRGCSLAPSRSSWTAGIFALSTLFACNGFWR